MKNTQHTLSICIPTFNRLHYLKESLEILLPQAQRLGVEVCVSDNHSTDRTVGYLSEMAERFSSLRFFVQGENIGLDRNMLYVISMGRGRYIFPMGDDDYLPEGAVEKILNELDEGSDMIILDGWHTDAFLVQQKRHLAHNIQGFIFSLPSEAFNHLWEKMPFGSFLANRECFSPGHFDRYIGTSHAYTGAVWDAVADKYLKTGACRVKCMSIPTVLLRGGEKSWRNDTAKIMLYEIPLWFQLVMENDVYKLGVLPIFNQYIQNQTGLVQLLNYRGSGQLDKKLVDRVEGMYSEHQISLMRKVIVLPVALLKLFYAVYYGIKNIMKRIVRR